MNICFPEKYLKRKPLESSGRVTIWNIGWISILTRNIRKPILLSYEWTYTNEDLHICNKRKYLSGFYNCPVVFWVRLIYRCFWFLTTWAISSFDTYIFFSLQSSHTYSQMFNWSQNTSRKPQTVILFLTFVSCSFLHYTCSLFKVISSLSFYLLW